MAIPPFILLNGNANQAIEFHYQSLDLKSPFNNTYDNSLMTIPPSQNPWILYSELSSNHQKFLMTADINQIKNVISLSLNFEDIRISQYNNSSIGGANHAIENQFWKAHSHR